MRDSRYNSIMYAITMTDDEIPLVMYLSLRTAAGALFKKLSQLKLFRLKLIRTQQTAER